jgi:hypothetical protein
MKKTIYVVDQLQEGNKTTTGSPLLYEACLSGLINTHAT